MILVIGGYCAGKTEYVISELGYLPDQISDAVLAGSLPVLNKLQDLVSSRPGQWESLLPELMSREVVICDETGCGIIPMDPVARRAREETGRLCVRLAREARAVVRLTCGIPEFIKGRLP